MPVAVFLSGHAVEQFRCSSKILTQCVREIPVDTAVLLFSRDRQRQQLRLIEITEFHDRAQVTSSDYTRKKRVRNKSSIESSCLLSRTPIVVQRGGRAARPVPAPGNSFRKRSRFRA